MEALNTDVNAGEPEFEWYTGIWWHGKTAFGELLLTASSLSLLFQYLHDCLIVKYADFDIADTALNSASPCEIAVLLEPLGTISLHYDSKVYYYLSVSQQLPCSHSHRFSCTLAKLLDPRSRSKPTPPTNPTVASSRATFNSEYTMISVISMKKARLECVPGVSSLRSFVDWVEYYNLDI